MPTADYSSYHQASGTGADGTKFSNFVDAVQATVNGLDKNNLAASAGILASQLADPTTGKVLGSSGSACAAVFPPGYEFNYKEFGAVSVTGTVLASATTVVTADPVTFDGATAIYVEFVCSYLTKGTTWIEPYVFDGSTSLGRLTHSASAFDTPGVMRSNKITPSAAAHTYSVRGLVDAGTGAVGAGAGGSTAGIDLPGYIRIVKA